MDCSCVNDGNRRSLYCLARRLSVPSVASQFPGLRIDCPTLYNLQTQLADTSGTVQYGFDISLVDRIKYLLEVPLNEAVNLTVDQIINALLSIIPPWEQPVAPAGNSGLTDLLNDAGIKAWVKRKLGFPTVQVELTDDQLQDAINDSLRLFNQHFVCCKHNAKYEVYTVAGGNLQPIQGFYSFAGTSDDPAVQGIQKGGKIRLDPETLGVYYVNFLLPNSLLNYTQINVFEILSRMVYPEMPMGEWYMIRMFYKMFQRVRGTEPEWIYDRENNTLCVDCSGGPFDVYYITLVPLTSDKILNGSKRRYQEQFLNLVLANAKMTLTMPRGKFGNIPSPGGTITTDVEALRTQAQAVIDQTTAFLTRMSAARSLPIVG
jgi:hypothetical protein